jgi:hypothetical protein
VKTLFIHPFLVVVVLLLPRSLPAAEPGEAAGAPPKVSQQVLDFIKPAPVEGDELHQKLAERHNAAVDLLTARKEQYDQGICSLDLVLNAARLVVQAKLELADSEDARKRALDNALEVAKLIEAHTRALTEKGLGSKADYQRARLGRLTIEVEVLKAKQAGKP